MRTKIYLAGIFLVAITASTLTYAAAGASLWGDPNSPSMDDGVATAAPAPSTAPVIVDEAMLPADQQTTTPAPQTETPAPVEETTVPATSAPEAAPVTKSETVAPPPPAKAKATKSAPVSKSKAKKVATPATAATTIPTDIDAPLIEPPATGTRTICDVFMQQATLKSDPLYNTKTREEVERRVNIVNDEFVFLLRDPVNANTLYTQYRDLYIKTYCTK